MVEYNHSTLDKKLLHIPFIITFYGSLNLYRLHSYLFYPLYYTLLRICTWVGYFLGMAVSPSFFVFLCTQKWQYSRASL